MLYILAQEADVEQLQQRDYLKIKVNTSVHIKSSSFWDFYIPLSLSIILAIIQKTIYMTSEIILKTNL